MSLTFYTIVAPAEIRANSPFHVSLTLSDFHKSCWFNFSLSTFISSKKLYDFESVEVKPGTTKLIEFTAPDLDYQFVNLDVFGYRGIISKDSALVQYQPDKYWALIQTNKFKYKPGDLVQFRVIYIDQLTRPLKENRNINIEIYDAEYNIVKGFFDIELVQGVFKGEFQLSNYPVLGVWKIEVDGYGIAAKKTFDVDRYVLPKFNVNIDANIVATEKEEDQIQLDISANYFYGEPVKGSLSLTFYPVFNQRFPTITRDLQIHGNTTIFLDFKNDLELEYEDKSKSQKELSPYSFPDPPYAFNADVTVIDDLSEEKVSAGTEVQINANPYYFELEAPEEFDPDNEVIKIKVKAFVKDITNSLIEEPKTPIEIVVGCGEVIGYNRNLGNFDKTKVEYKNEDGIDFVVNVTNKNYNECYLYAVFQGIKSKTIRMYSKTKGFDMEILTESPEEGKDFEVKITNPEPFDEFSYDIVSRGDIIQSERIFVPDNQTTYILRLKATFSMVPKITIYAHHIKNMKFGGQLKDVAIKRAVQNSIEITTEIETTPGSSVFINVTTNKGSYVGLMGLDRSALQNVDKEEILDQDFVNEQLRRVNSVKGYPIPMYGITATIITFSNVFLSNRENGAGGDEDAGGGGEKELVRKFFPESWLYKDFERTPEGGLSFMEKTPDTITTWALTAFSLHPETGLSFTKNIRDLRVFQQFFVSFDLPSLVKEDEIIEVPIYISNYMSQDALTNLTIESNIEDLDILEHQDDNSTTKQRISKLIPSQKRDKFTYFLKPLKRGQYNITVKAMSSKASDAVQKTLLVEPQGIPQEMSKSYLVHLPEEGSLEDEITIDIPENTVPGSQRVELSVVGDIFRPLMMILQKLARVPYGNGEDNMKLIVSNSIVLKYLNVLNYSDPGLESKIRQNLELGYQNQLSFKYLDGSFGLFERKTERTGDIWQTIFSLYGLRLAQDFVYVQDKVMNRGLDYLQSKQQENGCYKSENSLEDDVKLTAFGLMVFLMDKDSRTKYNETVSKGLEYLNDIWRNLEYTPISVMAAYVLFLGEHEKAEYYLKNLTSKAHLTNDQEQWTKSETLQSHLETTTESLMKVFESQEIPEQNLLHIARGLILSKNEESSIIHMVALNTLITFVKKLLLSDTNLNISFKDDQNKSGDFLLTKENSEVLQKFELTPSSRKIKLKSKGHGFALVDVNYVYNLLPQNHTSSIYSTNISLEYYSNVFNYLNICSSVLTNDTHSNYVIIEINVQSGYAFTETSFNEIENLNEDIKSIKFSNARDKAVIYFEYDPSNELCVELELRKSYNVFNSKPGWIMVYGEQSKEQGASNSFKFYDS